MPQVLQKSLTMSHEMSNCINTNSLGGKKDLGNLSIGFSGVKCAVTRNMPGGHQHEYPRLSFPVPIPRNTVQSGTQKKGVKNLALVEQSWLLGSYTFASGLAERKTWRL